MAVMRAAAALWEDRIPLYQFSLQFTPVPAYPSHQRSKLYQVRPVRRQVKSRPIIIYRYAIFNPHVVMTLSKPRCCYLSRVVHVGLLSHGTGTFLTHRLPLRLTEPTVTQYSPFFPITADYHLKTFTTPPSPLLAVPTHQQTLYQSPYCRPTNENTCI